MSEHPSPRVARWGALDAAVALIVFVGLIALGLAVSGPLVSLTGADPFALAFWSTLVLDLLLAAVVVVILRARGSGSVTRDLGLRFRPIDLALGPGFGILAKLVGALLVALLLVALHLPRTAAASNIPFDRSSPWSWALLAVIGCATAPIAEELLFRGLVLRGIQLSILRARRGGDPRAASRRRRMAAAIVAVAVSSVLFAAFHLYEAQNLTTAVAIGGQILVIGITHGVLTVVTGRLGPAILSHVVNNGLAFALLVAFPQLAQLAR